MTEPPMVGRFLGLALLAGGLAALYFGWQSTDSLSEQLVEGITGRYSDETMSYLIGGGVAAIVGLGLLLFSKK